jgi:RNA-splicing ligase RtcB
MEMIGKYTKAISFIDLIDEDDKDRTTIQQIYEFLNHEAFTNPVAIMPDAHKGNGACIGFTMELGEKVIPNVIGVDIGCGMLSMCLGPDFIKKETRGDLDDLLRENIPFGTNVHKNIQRSYGDYVPPGLIKEIQHRLYELAQKFFTRYGKAYTVPVIDDKWFEDKCEQIGMDYRRMLASIGTLGGGNHFIELGQSENTGYFWITFHTGSRQFGLKIAVHHQKLARSIVDRGELSWLTDENMWNYLVDMVVAQTYADENRMKMARIFKSLTDCHVIQKAKSVHNFIDFEDWIIRKGAIRSYRDEFMVIPFNMEDGLLICEGKSNKEWNYSAPHGAGRLGSRKWAKTALSLDEANKRMIEKDIYFSKLPLDETKYAYKPKEIIEDNIAPTADILDRIIPVLCMKE